MSSIVSIPKEEALNWVPLMRKVGADRWVKKHPLTLQASFFNILSKKYEEVQSGSIPEREYISYFEELFSYDLTEEELLRKGYFDVFYSPMGEEMCVIGSSIESHPTKGFGGAK